MSRCMGWDGETRHRTVAAILIVVFKLHLRLGTSSLWPTRLADVERSSKIKLLQPSGLHPCPTLSPTPTPASAQAASRPSTSSVPTALSLRGMQRRVC